MGIGEKVLIAAGGAIVGGGIGVMLASDEANIRSQDGFTIPSVGIHELADNPPYDTFFSLSFANFDSAIQLCTSILEVNVENSWSHGSVVMSLYYHGVELFLKGAVYKDTNKVFRTHRMDLLRKKYVEIYPDKKYEIPDAFVVHDLVGDAKALEERYKKIDQSFRYHLDDTGEVWDGIRTFDASLALADIQECYDRMKTLYSLLIKESEDA